MSDKGNLDFIAAKLGELQRELRQSNDKRLDAFTQLLSSIESSLADIVDNVERGGGAAAIEALASAIKAMKFAPPDVVVNPQITVQPADMPAPVVNVTVPEQAAPVVKVDVQPTPITMECQVPPAPAPIVHFLPAPQEQAVTWEVRIPGLYGAPDRVMTITRTK